jgi:hypothetical protein
VKRAHLGPTLAVVAAGLLGSGIANAAPQKVLVGGADGDSIAARVQKELTALGFDAQRVGALDGCVRKSVVSAAAEQNAIAAACSDGEQVGIWVSDGKVLRLRDVVVARDEGDRAREITAVRAAEVTRANIALHESEEENASRPSPAVKTVEPIKIDPGWESFDRPSKAPSVVVSTNRAPMFVVGAGMSALLGADSSVGAVSGQVQVGFLKHLTATARLDYPVESSGLQGTNSSVRIRPGFTGLGVGLPILKPTSFIIPRFGGGLGLAWIHARKPAGSASTNPFGPNNIVISNTEGTDTVASFALYGDAGVSMRVIGPFRLAADGVFGTTTSRLVAREQGVKVAYWGQPFAVFSMRAELLFP